MKKTVLFIMMLFIAFSGFADSSRKLKKSIDETIELLSGAFKKAYPDMTAKKGSLILDFEELSDKAKKQKLGNLVKVYLEEAMTNSMVLYLVDRKNLDAIQKEYILALSGFADEKTSVEPGYMSGAAALIHGSIIEENGAYKISVKLTDIATTAVLLSHSFSIPVEDMKTALDELRYEYVAKNGIGISTSSIYYLLPPDNFNKINPFLTELSIKYRLSKSVMLSTGIFISPITTGEYYRWDTGFDGYYPVSWHEIQPGLASTGVTDEEIGQITNSITDGFMTHITAQYTLNISPSFNIGFTAGAVFGLNYRTGYRFSSTGGLYYLTEEIDPTDPNNPYSIIKRDYSDIELIFNPFFGGRVEVAPEIFLTPRFALALKAGYMLTTSASVWGAVGEGGDWQFNRDSLDSGYNNKADENYFDFDPRIKPDGSTWAFNMTGLYFGISLSFFF